MSNGGAPSPGPPAEVLIFVLPPAGPGGQYSLAHYPRRKGDTKIFYTPQGQSGNSGKPREVKWIPCNLGPGQQLFIVEKADSPGQGHFGPAAPVQPGQSHRMSGPALHGPPTGGPDETWSYEVILRVGNTFAARLDPDVVISPDP